MVIPRKKRKKRPLARKPDLTIDQILVWADDFHRHTGRWPKGDSGRIPLRDETWKGVAVALVLGRRGLPGGSSLPKLLKAHRGVRNLGDLPPFNEGQILKWARRHFRRTGDWPNSTTGVVIDAPGETWSAINQALICGCRQLPGGFSLAKLLHFHEGVRCRNYVPPYDERQIRRWARDHFKRTGAWPIKSSGPIHGEPGETWGAVHTALHSGGRGLPGGTSLARFLQFHEGVRNRLDAPSLDEKRIRSWALDHFERTGRWPNEDSGAIPNAAGETWCAINNALTHGTRGLPGGTSLATLLSSMGVKRNRLNQPLLTHKQILAWADAYFRKHGKWPTGKSGHIDESPIETWLGIDSALRHARR